MHITINTKGGDAYAIADEVKETIMRLTGIEPRINITSNKPVGGSR